MRIPRATLLLLSFLPLLLLACSESTAPPSNGSQDGGNTFDGSFDPDAESFVLKRLDIAPPDYPPIYIELVGSNLQLDAAAATVSIDVAVKNVGSASLYPPGIVWLGNFNPGDVRPTNADYIVVPAGDPVGPLPAESYGYDYSELLGNVDELSPGETSVAKTWIFHDPGLAAFSFGATASFALVVDRPVLSGVLFQDLNRNGVRDRGEGPYPAGGVQIETPSGLLLPGNVDGNGRYRVPVDETGLYRVRFISMVLCVACECVTTPNPLEVLLPPGPDGGPQSFEHADFGIYPGPCKDPPPPPPGPPLLLSDAPPDSIESDQYSFLGAEVVGESLHMRVGFSGCQPKHPFALYAGTPLRDPYPAKTWLRLSHDDLGELCDAAWEQTLIFDLHPLILEHVKQYGAPGSVQLHFVDFEGKAHEFTVLPHLEVVTGTVVQIDDNVPSDGGAVIDLQREDGSADRLLFSSLFTAPPPPEWRWELYQVIAGLEVGDFVRAAGVRTERGLWLRHLGVREGSR